MPYQFFRKNVLPESENLVAKSFYIVSTPESDKASLHYVTANKSVKSFLNEEHVQGMINVANEKELFVVEDEEDLGSLELMKDCLVVVTGTLGDAPPEPKLFFYHSSSEQFIHLNKNHFHQNKEILDEIQENEDQQLVYRDNMVLNVSLCGSEW